LSAFSRQPFFPTYDRSRQWAVVSRQEAEGNRRRVCGFYPES